MDRVVCQPLFLFFFFFYRKNIVESCTQMMVLIDCLSTGEDDVATSEVATEGSGLGVEDDDVGFHSSYLLLFCSLYLYYSMNGVVCQPPFSFFLQFTDFGFITKDSQDVVQFFISVGGVHIRGTDVVNQILSSDFLFEDVKHFNYLSLFSFFVSLL
jgi:hypothetical protein